MPEPPGSRLKLISSAVFDATEYKLTWLVKGILVALQAAIWGGPKKCMKTSTLIDLALALSGLGRFLGHFEVTRPVRVGLFSGESGEHTIQETARRIARSRGYDLAQSLVYWGFTIPKVARQKDLDQIRKLVVDLGLEVVIVDPLYLSLLGGGVEVDPRNVFQMGPVLLDFARACLEHNCTPIVAHHAKKEGRKEYKPLDLDDLSYSGVAEFARQWFLVNRRNPYVDGSGYHELWARAGGSVGFGGLYGVDVAEGSVDMAFAGRTWDVKVLKTDDVRQDQEMRKQDEERQKKRSRDAEEIAQALKVFQRTKRIALSKADLERETGWGPKRVTRAVALLLAEGMLTHKGKDKAANGRMVDWYSLVQRPAQQ
jgi:hypothetical protein